MGRKGLEGRVVCGVWERRREGERERGGERRGGRREGMNLSLSTTPHQLPCGAYTLRGYTLQTLSYTLSLNPYPSNPDPKMGDPHLLPTRGKGGKRGGKEHFLTILSSIFLSGGEPPDPPSNWDAQEKDKKSEGAR